jgi:hypothetical protein
MDLKPDSRKLFTECLEQEVLPLLRGHAGFQDEMAFVAANGTKAFAISFWDSRESADAYTRETYPRVMTILAKVLEGAPRVRSYEVASSTCHNIAAGA